MSQPVSGAQRESHHYNTISPFLNQLVCVVLVRYHPRAWGLFPSLLQRNEHQTWYWQSLSGWTKLVITCLTAAEGAL